MNQAVDSESFGLIRHRAAVLGDPIEHSLSPAIHNAGYRAAGLSDWHYGRIRTSAAELPGIVSGADRSFAGFSVTMPGKFAALDFADTSSERARLIGSANTLVRRGDSWFADNTDADGIAGALDEVGFTTSATGRAVVVGAGGTARPALWALAQRGVRHLTVVARSERALQLEPLAAALGLEFQWVAFDVPNLMDIAGACDVLISTVPAAALESYNAQLARAPRVVDVIYDPWPTALVDASRRAGGHAVGGLTMLLHQAVRQFELFTGVPADVEAMRAALPAH